MRFERSAVLDRAGVVRALARLLRTLEKRLETVDTEVQEIVVHVADGHVQFADQFRTHRAPVVLDVIAKVVPVRTHRLGHHVIDATAALIPRRLRIPIVTHRTPGRGPTVPLTTGATMRRDHQLGLILFANREVSQPFDTATRRNLARQPRTILHHKCVGVGVDIAELIIAKVELIGIQRPRPAEHVGIVNLQAEHVPAAG